VPEAEAPEGFTPGVFFFLGFTRGLDAPTAVEASVCWWSTSPDAEDFERRIHSKGFFMVSIKFFII